MSSGTPRFNMSKMLFCSICREEFWGRTATVCEKCRKKKHDHKRWLVKQAKTKEAFIKGGSIWKSKTS